ncbi:MAG TPA: competence/damage-inducible protein A [Candidatus Saccharicenans sp.]|jgi:nicotinamide-nucleotide amidase|nr:competence/damage-inducible protein A [Candidatus Saccharicenans sp.]HRD01143.1 competence/damage-inducible protein A [Candidatus Saccharicenans sp.]
MSRPDLNQVKENIEYIAIGSELLTSSYPETNSLFLADKLENLGLEIKYKSVVSDRLDDIVGAVKVALSRSRLIFISGGLGPTDDDRTREAVARVVKRPLVFCPAILKKIKDRFAARGAKMTPSNRKQAYIIKGAEVLDNPNGTAPGLWLETRTHLLALLPGPPPEFNPMVEKLIEEKIGIYRNNYVLKAIIRTTGAGESWVEDRIKPVYRLLPPELELTTLASPGEVQIRLTLPVKEINKQNEKIFNKVKDMIIKLLGDKVFSTEGQTLEEVVGHELSALGQTLACAESCTGGLLADRITSVPGSSNYFLAGLVTYSNKAKTKFLGVPSKLIKEKGAVSREVAESMAAGARKQAPADLALAITGIAGPGGGSSRKPVGLVYIGLASQDGINVVENYFQGNRRQIKVQATQKALDMLRLKSKNKKKSIKKDKVDSQ